MVANLNYLEIDNVLKFKGYLIATKPIFLNILNVGNSNNNNNKANNKNRRKTKRRKNHWFVFTT